jgi:hypothetical protein
LPGTPSANGLATIVSAVAKSPPIVPQRPAAIMLPAIKSADFFRINHTRFQGSPPLPTIAQDYKV